MTAADRASARRVVRRRTDNQGSRLNPRKATIRMSEADSARLMQWQGLARKYGNRDMVWLWRNVCAPALKAHCEAVYVPMAREEKKRKGAAR